MDEIRTVEVTVIQALEFIESEVEKHRVHIDALDISIGFTSLILQFGRFVSNCV